MRIYLIGMPGSGKTTLGKKLAEELQYAFVDLDIEIENGEGLSIPEIFENEGEEYFRRAEKLVLQKTTPDNTVIATGGGAPCFFDNMEFINAHGISVFIDTSVEEIAQRVLSQKGTRPLLSGVDEKEEMVSKLSKKRQDRIEYYKQAHITVNDSFINTADLSQLIKDFAKAEAN